MHCNPENSLAHPVIQTRWRTLAASMAVALLWAAMPAQAQQGAELSVEAPLMTGGLGRASETNALGAGFSSGLGNASAAQLLSRPSLVSPKAGLADPQDQKLAVKLELPPLESTQFQKFVQDATGKSTALYGYNLFDSGRFPSVTEVPAPANYVLGVGDEIDLKIWGAVDVALRLPVDRNGQITIPKVGPVTVAGVQADQLEKTLKNNIGRVFNNFELSATLGRLRSVQVFVVGQARKPGAYMVSSLSTLVSALFESGGPAATGSMRQIRLVRQGKTVTTFDLYQFIHAGLTAADARLQAGDVIVIPPAGARVALVGMLDTPAIYELSGAQESLSQLLAYSGGQQALASSAKALVERIQSGTDTAPRSVEERTLTADGLKTTVRDGDVVTLLKISPEFANAITLRGNVAQPLRHAFRPGMRISDLIPDPASLIQRDYFANKNELVQFENDKRSAKGGLTKATNSYRDDEKSVSKEQLLNDVKNQLSEINWDYASVERLDAKSVKTDLIPFNLARAIKDKDAAHNLQLQPGDVVTIFGVNDLPVPMARRNQFVRLSGEVNVPGIYQLLPGETLPQLVQRAGGMSRQSFAYGTVFTRESTRAQQQDNLNKAIRRLEASASSQSASLLQNMSEADKANAAQLQAQQAAQKSVLERMRGLKASGRIALEMDPAQPVLPSIALEDGDNIVIPHTSSFVAVFGSVLAETSFIHKPGHTVGNYIDKAGPMREADLDAALLIRADGTVQANNAQRNWMGWGHTSFMNTPLQPGDSVFVPEVLDRRTAYTQFIQGAKDWTAILYQFGIGAAALKTLNN